MGALDWYAQHYGTCPYCLTPHDIVKGIIFGLAAQGGMRLLDVRKTDRNAAIAGVFTGVAGGLEDILDAFMGRLVNPENPPFGGPDPVHELFQGGIITPLISTLTSVGLNKLLKAVT